MEKYISMRSWAPGNKPIPDFIIQGLRFESYKMSLDFWKCIRTENFMLCLNYTTDCISLSYNHINMVSRAL